MAIMTEGGWPAKPAKPQSWSAYTNSLQSSPPTLRSGVAAFAFHDTVKIQITGAF
jgi:hypothetical protein